MVGGDDEPGDMFGAASAESRLECAGVGAPIGTFRIVARADFPMPRRIVDPLLEAHELFLGIDLEIKLQDMCTVVREHLLEGIDVVIAPGPDRARHHFFGTPWPRCPLSDSEL